MRQNIFLMTVTALFFVSMEIYNFTRSFYTSHELAKLSYFFWIYGNELLNPPCKKNGTHEFMDGRYFSGE